MVIHGRKESNLDLSIPLIYKGVLIRLQIADVYNYWPLSEMFCLVFSRVCVVNNLYAAVGVDDNEQLGSIWAWDNNCGTVLSIVLCAKPSADH